MDGVVFEVGDYRGKRLTAGGPSLGKEPHNHREVEGEHYNSRVRGPNATDIVYEDRRGCLGLKGFAGK